MAKLEGMVSTHDAPSCCGASRGEADDAGAPESAQSESDGPAVPGPPRAALQALTAAASGQLSLLGLDGGAFRMGSEDQLAYPQDGEGPVRSVEVAPFAIAATTVTVAEFATFVLATGHRSDAERMGDSLVFSGKLESGVADSLPRVADAPWWAVVPGATWFSPEGPGSEVRGREDHPVTHVSQRDAQAYAEWVGARLPSEEEWEFAARGGLDQQPYPWGGVRDPEGQRRMNIFPGSFPDAPDGPVGTVPVRSYAPNGYGLFNVTGNVWEWTASPFQGDPAVPAMRGGSYMCHESYCRRYRTSARSSATADTSLGHTGFRLALSR
ncbi:formylglycine-generating enzyme family protein [Nesterenkonia xinjiangensis]|uniref:Formylglycine-generating enzyme required for sulfatase activity n=1 Tax=Nesterenkonia xinjiangensis TaxID=225327 RepID=A0A7Z0GPJ5_9MICC|nr:formylglycine-generating enzyme family protein [Nesterenkonia xinjiangensis]NYJ78916.1 formylglycine-generating enzyme required for sulfatase activity [Nesterenkonia xinjiangensis]